MGFSLWGLLSLQSMVSRQCQLSSRGTWAQLLHGLWDLPGLGIELVSPTLSGRFLTTKPPGKSPIFFFNLYWNGLVELGVLTIGDCLNGH